MNDWSFFIWLRRVFTGLQAAVIELWANASSEGDDFGDVVDVIVDALWDLRVSTGTELLVPERVTVYLNVASLAFWANRADKLRVGVEGQLAVVATRAQKRTKCPAVLPDRVEILLLASDGSKNRAEASFAADPVNVAPHTRFARPRLVEVPTVPYVPDFVAGATAAQPVAVLQVGGGAATRVPLVAGLRIGREFDCELIIPSSGALIDISRLAGYVQQVTPTGARFHIDNQRGATLEDRSGQRRALGTGTSVELQPGHRLHLADDPTVVVWVEVA